MKPLRLQTDRNVLWIWMFWTVMTMTTLGLEFSSKFQDTFAPVGHPFSWTCAVQDDGQSTELMFIWRFQGADLGDDQNRQMWDNGTMYFPQVTSSVLGVYTCVVQGPGAIIEKSVTLAEAYISDVVTIRPSEEWQIFAGDTATLECLVDSRPSALITWWLNGGHVTEGPGVQVTVTVANAFQTSVLQLSNVDYHAAGDYFCSASHTSRTQPVQSVTSTIRVFGSPQITTPPVSQAVPVGYNVQFRCEVASDPPSTISWSFMASTSQTPLPLSTSSSITIDQADGTLSILAANPNTDNGAYTCTWTNAYGSDLATATLYVEGVPQEPVLFDVPSDQSVDEGSTFTLTCSGTGNPIPTISWTLPDGRIVSRNRVGSNDQDPHHETDSYSIDEEGTLLVQNVTRQDMGTFTCNLSNPEGHVGASAVVNIMYNPTIITKPVDMLVEYASDFTLPCAVAGNPQPIIKWILPQNRVLTVSNPSANRNEIVTSDGTLKVFEAGSSHHGLYTCVVENTVGESSASAIITVSGPPGFLETPASLGVIEEDAVFLRCTPSSNSEASVEWFHKYMLDPSTHATDVLKIKESLLSDITQFPTSDILRIGVESEGRYELKNGSLSIHNVQESDAGMYVCQAKNEFGSNIAAAVLRVITFPRFEAEPGDQRVALGGTAVLYCHATGIPVPSQRWLFENRSLPPRGDITAFTNGTLVVQPIIENNLGVYTCLATNQAGQRSAHARLSVSDKPVFVTSPVSSSSPRGGTATMICRGNSALQYHQSWYVSTETGEHVSLIGQAHFDQTASTSDGSSDAQRVFVSPDGDLHFSCVEEGDEMWYVCVLENSDGVAVSNPVFLEVLSAPVIEIFDVSDIKDPDELINLACSASGAPIPQISWISPMKFELTGTDLREPSLVVTNTPVSLVLARSEVRGVADPSRHAGVWICKACNTLGCSSLESDLTIAGEPVIIGVDSESLRTEISLHCKPSSSSHVSFFRDFDIINNATDGHRIVGNSLFVDKARIAQGYSCLVTNSFGSSSLDLSTPPDVTFTTLTPRDSTVHITLSTDVDRLSVLPNEMVLEYKNRESSAWLGEIVAIDEPVDRYLTVLQDILSPQNISSNVCSIDDALALPQVQGLALQQDSPQDEIQINSIGSIFQYTIKTVVSSLQPQTSYDFRARARNVLGYGLYTPIMTVNTLAGLPPTVSNVQVRTENRSALVTWDISSPLNGQPDDVVFTVTVYNRSDDDVVGEMVHRNQVRASEPKETSFSTLPLGDYTLSVFSSNVNANTKSETVWVDFSVTISPPSFVPKISALSAVDWSSVNVTWETPVDPLGLNPVVTGYRISAQLANPDDSTVITEKIVDISDPLEWMWIITDLSEHREYIVRVASRNSAGAGPYSSGVSVVTQYTLFSEAALDDTGISSIPWRLITVILIVVCASLIILVSAVVCSYQVKLSRSKSLDLETEPELRDAFGDDDDIKLEEQQNGLPRVNGFHNEAFVLY